MVVEMMVWVGVVEEEKEVKVEVVVVERSSAEPQKLQEVHG